MSGGPQTPEEREENEIYSTLLEGAKIAGAETTPDVKEQLRARARERVSSVLKQRM